MLNPKDFPLLTEEGPFDIEPLSIFRVESRPFPVGDFNIIGNALLFFTGTMAKGIEEGGTLLHCLPMMFYGMSADLLTDHWQDQDLWVEVVTSPKQESFWGITLN